MIASSRLVLLACVLGAVMQAQATTTDTLFRRAGAGPILAPDPEFAWRSAMTANAGLIRGEDAMLLFLRGTRFVEGRERSSIGLLRQETATFDPRGPWREAPGNPRIAPGPAGAYDDLFALDASPVRVRAGDAEAIYCYYSAVQHPWNYSLAGAVSRDGGGSFVKFAGNPLKRHVGVSDVVHHDGRFHLFYVDAQWDEAARRNRDLPRIRSVRSTDPERFDFAGSTVAVSPGRGWDRFSIGGGRVFALDGRWWMIYQGSDTHWDYPWRFGLAVSDDLQVWSKLRHPRRPLFLRGPDGAWDQGAIWHGEVLVWEGALWLYYEGWGAPGFARERNLPYYRGGRSQLGLARCTVDGFRRWVAEAESVGAE